jgi:hypothetical protein
MAIPNTPRFAIGTQFKTQGKAPRICTVRDILRTYNNAGELVLITYVATHDFMGQEVSEVVVDTTVARGAPTINGKAVAL